MNAPSGPLLVVAAVILLGTAARAPGAEFVNFSFAWALQAKQQQGEHLTPEEQAYVTAAQSISSLAFRRPLAPAPEGPREFFVDNERGDDTASGLAHAPVRTLARAVALLRPGDTLHLAANSRPYRETLQLFDVSGIAGHPIVIDGHGALLTGCEPLPSADWTEVKPGLFRNSRLIDQLVESNDATKLQRMFLVIDGAQQRMGRTSKGARPALKPIAALQPGEWTFDSADRSFYVRLDGGLVDGHIEAPVRRNGVAFLSLEGITDVVVQNLTVTRVLNDGFNFHGFGIRNVRFKNIAARECGDDGFSAHEDAQCFIEDFRAAHNSTGVANIGTTTLRAHGLRLEENYATELLFGQSARAELSDVVASAARDGRALGFLRSDAVEVQLDNARLQGADSIEIPSGATVQLFGCTAIGPAWRVGGNAFAFKSVFDTVEVRVQRSGKWQGGGNLYRTGASLVGTSDVNPRQQPMPARLD